MLGGDGITLGTWRLTKLPRPCTLWVWPDDSSFLAFKPQELVRDKDEVRTKEHEPTTQERTNKKTTRKLQVWHGVRSCARSEEHGPALSVTQLHSDTLRQRHISPSSSLRFHPDDPPPSRRCALYHLAGTHRNRADHSEPHHHTPESRES